MFLCVFMCHWHIFHFLMCPWSCCCVNSTRWISHATYDNEYHPRHMSSYAYHIRHTTWCHMSYVMFTCRRSPTTYDDDICRRWTTTYHIRHTTYDMVSYDVICRRSPTTYVVVCICKHIGMAAICSMYIHTWISPTTYVVVCISHTTYDIVLCQ